MKLKISMIIVSIINVILFIMLIISLNNKNNKSVNPNDIFNKCKNSVVEIKAYNDNYESFGSGVFINDSGLIITNYHVISYKSLNELNTFENIEIRFNNTIEYEKVSFVKMDNELDLAIIKYEGNNKYKSISFGKDNYSFGDKVYAVGNTSNYGIGISEGIISVPLVNIVYEEIKREMIQVDINIAQGNSGGALVNKNNKLIGITTLRTKDLNGNINYGYVYAIPIKIIKGFIKG